MILIPKLHSAPINDGWWWACSEPERPLDMFIVWEPRCPKCIMQAELVLHVHGDVDLWDIDSTLAVTKLSEIVKKWADNIAKESR